MRFEEKMGKLLAFYLECSWLRQQRSFPMINIPQQTVLFPELFSKPVSVSFFKDHLSSNGGLLLLKPIDRKLGLTKAVAATFLDKRRPEKIRHEILDLARQRIFGLAAGYPDCNDAQHLKQDPAMKLLCDREPISGDALGSQPTLSRLENSVTSAQLLDLAGRIAGVVLRDQARRLAYKAEVVVKDGDHRDNDRYVVTNLGGNYCPHGIFNFYYGHNDMENTIKDLNNDLSLGRTGGCSFLANQLHLL